MDKAIIAELILGTYEHDLFKPFWLGNFQHALLGYAWQRAAGRSEARCAAVLLHNAENILPNRARHLDSWPAGQHTLPRALLLAPAMDWIASASYALYDEEAETAAEERLSDGDEQPKPTDDRAKRPAPLHKRFEAWPASIQNPFSRLPVWEGAVLASRATAVISEQGTFGNAGDFVTERFRPKLAGEKWAEALTGALRDLGKAATAAAGRPVFERILARVRSLSAEQRDLLGQVYTAFPERTYPPPNDTGLAAHTRLTANLYHLALAQLPAGHGLAGLGLELMGDDEIRWWTAYKNRARTVSEALKHLSCDVATVRLAGLEERFVSAVRLDDLQGVKQLADRMRYAFKRQMLASLGFAGAPDADRLADVLCLSESRFAMTYLLPADYARDEDEMRERLHGLYDAAWQDVASKPYGKPEGGWAPSLLETLAGDLGEARAMLRPDAERLVRGLQVMLPAFGVARVDTADLAGESLEERFGQRLVEGYGKALREASPGSLGREAWQATTLGNWTPQLDEAICDRCQGAPAWTALGDQAYGRNGQPANPTLEKFFHGFREEQEELCEACAAQRSLAHGVTQAEALATMIWGEVAPDGSVKLDFGPVLGADGTTQVALPPLLHRKDAVRPDETMVDLNACYIRRRRDGGDDLLERFPTVAYAADRNSNVAMLTLRTTDALIGEQMIPEGCVKLLTTAGDKAREALRAWHDLRWYYFFLDRAGKEEALHKQLLELPAHLARVLQRQATVTAFYEMLPRRWAAAGVRALALETRHPVGRYLLPAEALTTALEVLDRSLCLDLLAVNGEDLGLVDADAMTHADAYDIRAQESGSGAVVRERALRALLCSYVPKLVVGTALVFKQKQALYLMLRAEERLQREVVRRPVAAVGLADMRGTLVDRGTVYASYGFGTWADVREMAQGVDRDSLAGLMTDWDRVAEAKKRGEPAAALTAVAQANWVRRASAADVKQRVKGELRRVGEEDSDAAQAVRAAAFFLARATRA